MLLDIHKKLLDADSPTVIKQIFTLEDMELMYDALHELQDI